ncbi:hypothetical protein TNIN_187611 [Trichonephila inaurata madagascariensis]|uniref:Uncharacterized protein n=1 Tax=Trichonephila inaurata madagascariensis TaxID=2747483 RepID=A0A8X6Y830_9ARAC|nr:hypothetical protein TNIN_187611 [Trichonephila inaurata madagascariensis]
MIAPAAALLGCASTTAPSASAPTGPSSRASAAPSLQVQGTPDAGLQRDQHHFEFPQQAGIERSHLCPTPMNLHFSSVVSYCNIRKKQI